MEEVDPLISHSDSESEDVNAQASPRCPICDKSVEEVGSLVEVGELKLEGSEDFYLCGDCLEFWSSLFEESKGGATQQAIDQFLAKLTDAERCVTKLLYGLENGYNYSPEEVGQFLGITPEQVQEIGAEAIVKLKAQNL
jgi:DNA-directed RNA polymerase sigma subunit (sigma70/sigma32)